VATLARPGGNATGLTIMMSETMTKSVELLKAALPGLTKLGLGPGHTVASARHQGRRGRVPRDRLPTSRGAGADRRRVRRRLLGSGAGARRRGARALDAALHGRGHAARRAGPDPQAAHDVRAT
jgi:hypothetical protein